MSKCRIGQKINQGTYGTVFLAPSGSSVIKLFDTIGPESLVEIDILFRLHSPYLLGGLNIYKSRECSQNSGFGLEMELLDGEMLSLIQGGNMTFDMIKQLVL